MTEREKKRGLFRRLSDWLFADTALNAALESADTLAEEVADLTTANEHLARKCRDRKKDLTRFRSALKEEQATTAQLRGSIDAAIDALGRWRLAKGVLRPDESTAAELTATEAMQCKLRPATASKLDAENIRLRNILARTTKAVGGFALPSVTVEFLERVPDEVHLLKVENEQLKALLAAAGSGETSNA